METKYKCKQQDSTNLSEVAQKKLTVSIKYISALWSKYYPIREEEAYSKTQFMKKKPYKLKNVTGIQGLKNILLHN